MTVLSQNWTAANCDSLHYIVAGSFFTPAAGQRSAFLSGALLLHFQESCSMFCKRQRTATLFSEDSDVASNVQLMRCNGKIFSNLRRKHHPTCAEKDKSFGKFGGGGHKKRARATSEVFFSTCCMLSSTLQAAAMCLTLDLFCVRSVHKSTKFCCFPAWLINRLDPVHTLCLWSFTLSEIPMITTTALTV